jgi:hypothetical protein
MRQQIEAGIQRQIVDWVRAVAPDILIFAVPNGSQRTASGRPANAVYGMVSGAPDLALVLPMGRMLWLEVKSSKGRVSDAQLHFHLELEKRNHICAVVRSVDDVRQAFKTLDIATRESKIC